MLEIKDERDIADALIAINEWLEEHGIELYAHIEARTLGEFICEEPETTHLV